LHDLIQRLLASYQHSLQSGGYLYIVFLMALESSVIPLPSELVIPPAILLVDAGKSTMSLPGIVLAAAIGSLLGASIMYWASRIAGRPLVVRYGKLMLNPMERIEGAERRARQHGGLGAVLARALSVFRHAIGVFLITPAKIERAERWSARFGSFGIFLSRMLPVVRHLIGIPAGIVRMRFWKFSLYTFLGSAFWCFVLAEVSHIAGRDERLMRGEIREITLWAAGAAVILGAAYYFLVHRLSREEA
jgi:membrane protein DedA with SNARE-associated domain